MKFTVRLGMAALVSSLGLTSPSFAGPVMGEALPQPVSHRDSLWNVDVTWAPVDWASWDFILFLNRFGDLRIHPNLGGDFWEDPGRNFGYPYIVVDEWQPKVTVQFDDPWESDGVGYPFYPIPDEAIWYTHWIEGGQPGYVDARGDDRHMLIIDRQNNWLYELYNVWFDLNSWQWHAYAGGFWNLALPYRQPQFHGASDEGGVAILPGLLRYEEVYGPDEINHAIRVAIPSANGFVYPATRGDERWPGSLPLGARLRLRADKDISGYRWDVQKILRAMKKYGLLATTKIGAYVPFMMIQGTYDVRWDNGVLNPACHSLSAWDFEIVELGWQP